MLVWESTQRTRRPRGAVPECSARRLQLRCSGGSWLTCQSPRLTQTNIWKSAAFLHTNKDIPEREIKEMIAFTIASQGTPTWENWAATRHTTHKNKLHLLVGGLRGSGVRRFGGLSALRKCGPVRFLEERSRIRTPAPDCSGTPTSLSFSFVLSHLYPFSAINHSQENRIILVALSPSRKSSNPRAVFTAHSPQKTNAFQFTMTSVKTEH